MKSALDVATENLDAELVRCKNFSDATERIGFTALDLDQRKAVEDTAVILARRFTEACKTFVEMSKT